MMLGPCFLPVSQTTIKHVAVAVGKSSPRYFHAALLYRGANGVSALDIDLSGLIGAKPAAESTSAFAWSIPVLHDDSAINDYWLEQISFYCESIGKSPRHLTYSFAFNSLSQIKEVGDHFVAFETEGFTCATLVLAVFQTAGLPLLDLSTWGIKPEDTEWAKDVYSVMQRYQHGLRLSDEDLKNRLQELPCPRYSPRMVLGACRIGAHPADCQLADTAGREAVGWLETSLRCHS